MRFWLFTAMAVLMTVPAGCATTGLPTPIVDMEGIDPVKLNRDLAQCAHIMGRKILVLGDGMARCMSEKGYRVLVSY